MQVVVDFQDEQVEFDVPDDRIVDRFRGPAGIPTPARGVMVAEALNQPLDFPPIASMFVPGDRVAVAFDARCAGDEEICSTLIPILRAAVGPSGEIVVVSTTDLRQTLPSGIIEGNLFITHDPSDREQLAYLATTQDGRRVYLNRHLTDADVVIGVGAIGYDSTLGIRGPWSVIFPELSDDETRAAFASASGTRASENSKLDALLAVSLEASWLLGSQFFLGVLPGRSGISGVVAGLGTAVSERAKASLSKDWAFRAASRAEMVVAGVGLPGVPTRLEDLVEGISNAAKLVHHGGKIVVLSRAEGAPGPAMRRLSKAGEPRLGTASLKGHESDEDFQLAQRLNEALVWADIYLLSGLDSGFVEDLSMVPLEKPREAVRLASGSHSTIFLSQANLIAASVADDD